jgi:hypothetical protein
MNINEVKNGKCYKIRRKSDGLFATGGFHYGSVRWDKNGKMWKRLGDLHNHFAGQSSKANTEYFQDAEIVEYEVSITEMRSWSVAEHVKERGKKAKEKERKRIERDKKLKEDSEKRKLKELLRKYGADI